MLHWKKSYKKACKSSFMNEAHCRIKFIAAVQVRMLYQPYKKKKTIMDLNVNELVHISSASSE